MAAKNPDVKYALGSVLNHVLLHQTIIGQEAIKQFEMAGDDPDVVIGCAGGGSNFAGLAFPFLGLQLRGGRKRRFIAVEPAACPSLTRGKYAYDFGDTAHLTPLVKMHTLGSTFIPPGFHAGGLRYHGMAPLVSHLYELGLIEARAYHQKACFEAGVQFARCEGIVPAPESTHAVRCAIDEALRCKQRARRRPSCSTCRATAISTWAPTSAYFEGKLVDQNYDEGELAMALAGLPASRRSVIASLLRKRCGVDCCGGELLLPACGEKVGMRGPIRVAQICGNAPSPHPLPAQRGEGVLSKGVTRDRAL